MEISLEQIKLLIPHRKPFLFLDSVNIIEIGDNGIGFKKFNKDEYFFEGHFPNMPIVPGVVLVEAMAQTAGVVVSKKYEDYPNKSVLFASVNKAKFRKPVYPGDEIIFKVKILNKVKNVYKFSGVSLKSDQIVCQAEFSAMLSFS